MTMSLYHRGRASDSHSSGEFLRCNWKGLLYVVVRYRFVALGKLDKVFFSALGMIVREHSMVSITYNRSN